MRGRGQGAHRGRACAAPEVAARPSCGTPGPALTSAVRHHEGVVAVDVERLHVVVAARPCHAKGDAGDRHKLGAAHKHAVCGIHNVQLRGQGAGVGGARAAQRHGAAARAPHGGVVLPGRCARPALLPAVAHVSDPAVDCLVDAHPVVPLVVEVLVVAACRGRGTNGGLVAMRCGADAPSCSCPGAPNAPPASGPRRPASAGTAAAPAQRQRLLTCQT